jgi:hypothetical protein
MKNLYEIQKLNSNGDCEDKFIYLASSIVEALEYHQLKMFSTIYHEIFKTEFGDDFMYLDKMYYGRNNSIH